MKFNIKATNIELTPEIRKHIEEKINSLDKFIKYKNSSIQSWVEIDRTTKHHQTGKIWRAEIQIHLPKKSVRAEAVSNNIFTAINETVDELQIELKKYKEKKIEAKTKSISKINN